MAGVWRAVDEGCCLTGDPGVHLLVDAQSIHPGPAADSALRFEIDGPVRAIVIRSRSVVPAAVGLAPDGRRLGIHVNSLVIEAPGLRREIAPAECAAARGWHALEGSSRWTDGAAVLPPHLFGGIAQGFVLTLHVTGTQLRYPDVAEPSVAGFDRRRGVILFGGWEGSDDAVRVMVRSVMPLARVLVPGLGLHVHGVSRRLHAAGDAETRAPDPLAVGLALECHRILVAPMSPSPAAAAGLIAGLGHGIAVIASPGLAEQVGLTHGIEVLVAADPMSIATAIARLEDDRALWARLSEAGLAWFAAHRGRSRRVTADQDAHSS